MVLLDGGGRGRPRRQKSFRVCGPNGLCFLSKAERRLTESCHTNLGGSCHNCSPASTQILLSPQSHLRSSFSIVHITHTHTTNSTKVNTKLRRFDSHGPLLAITQATQTCTRPRSAASVCGYSLLTHFFGEQDNRTKGFR